MPETTSADSNSNEFCKQSKLKVVVIGVVGGPGSGKGTQCKRLAQSLPLEHLSIGDLMREEMAIPGSPHADIIRENMIAGRVGPPEFTVSLLRRRMEAAMCRGIHTFILDGFPRKIEQCEYMERTVAQVQRLIVLDCSDTVLIKRLSAANRDRFDDKENDIILKRIKTFRDTTSKVIAQFESRGKASHVDGEQEVDTVAEQIYAIVQSVMDGE